MFKLTCLLKDCFHTTNCQSHCTSAWHKWIQYHSQNDEEGLRTRSFVAGFKSCLNQVTKIDANPHVRILPWFASVALLQVKQFRTVIW